jgi:hypothetical protein
MNSINLEYLLERHNQGWSLEQAFYTNQQVFDFEWENIWKNIGYSPVLLRKFQDREIILHMRLKKIPL